MAWISIHQQIRDHRKTRNLFRTLGINRAEAIGTLTLIWTWAVDNCNQEGELLSVTMEDIADAAYWKNDPAILYSALVETGWVDEFEGKMYLHDWGDFNKPFYDYIAKKEKDKQRKRNGVSAEIPRKVAGDSTESSGEFHVSPSPSPSPSPSHLDINNNNNAREELSNEKEPVEVITMAIGTQSVNWAEKSWGRMMSPGEIGEINTWCDEFKTRGCVDPDAVAIEALKQCDYAGVRNMKYLRAVLTDWRESGVLTVAQVEAREAERKNQKDHKRNKDPGNKHPKAPSGKFDKFYQ